MVLIVYYVIFMVAGDVADYVIGIAVESIWGMAVSLWVFVLLYFFFLWLAWVLAVWATRPKEISGTSG
jgi:hypothetical protein